MAFKFSDCIQPFSGKSDFAEWIRKVEMVASLQKINQLEKFVPLFLSEGAFAVYDSLSSDKKEDYKNLKYELLKAFSPNPHRALNDLIQRKLEPNESVDVFAADVRRLACLIDPKGSEEYIKCFFVRGLPDGARNQLLASCSISDMTLAEVVSKSRMLLASGSFSIDYVGAVSTTKKVYNTRPSKVIECYACGKIGHISRFCHQRSNDGTGASGGITCHLCGEAGHISPKCPKRSLPKNE
jgi:hypothetical protein